MLTDDKTECTEQVPLTLTLPDNDSECTMIHYPCAKHACLLYVSLHCTVQLLPGNGGMLTDDKTECTEQVPLTKTLPDNDGKCAMIVTVFP